MNAKTADTRFRLIEDYPESPRKGTVVFNMNKEGHLHHTGVPGSPSFIRLETLNKYPNHWRKLGQFLFMSEEGYDIFEGDDVHYVYEGNIFKYSMKGETYQRASLLKHKYKVFLHWGNAYNYLKTQLNKEVNGKQ